MVWNPFRKENNSSPSGQATTFNESNGKFDLKLVITSYSSYLKDVAKLYALLRQLYPSATLERTLAISAFEYGIVDKIKCSTVVTNEEMVTYTHQLENNYGLQTKYAQEAISLWASAYGISIGGERKNTNRIEIPVPTTNQEHTSLKSPMPVSSPQLSKSFPNKNTSQDAENRIIGNPSDFEVKRIRKGKIEISRYLGFDQETIVIPNIIDGQDVIGVGTKAFAKVSIHNLIISQGITYIGEASFSGCGIYKISFPSTLVSIGSLAFESNFCLSDVHLPDSISSLGSGAFKSCGLNTISLPSSLSSIPDSAFWGNNNLKEVTIPGTIFSIGNSAFEFCSELHSVVISEGVRRIESLAFAEGNFNGLTIVIPNSVNYLSKDAFGYANLGLHNKPTIVCNAGSVGYKWARNYECRVVNAANYTIP